MLRVILFFFSLYSSVAISDGWVISGGELLKDAANPWFIKTWSASYCVDIDEENFSLPKARASEIVKEVLEAWRKDFAKSLLVYNRFNVQTNFVIFNETNCQHGVDLKIKFGKLKSEEKRNLLNWSKHIAVTVRTDYDVKKLRGEGFIYISPDRGADNILHQQNPTLPKDFGSVADGKLLYLTLLHEMGHVFGLQHEGVGEELMSVEFVDNIFRGDNFAKIVERKELPTFFDYTQTIDRSYCKPRLLLHYKAAEYFGLPKEWKCLRIVADAKSYRVFGKAELENTDWIELGFAQFDAEEVADYRNVVNVYVDWNKQAVFENITVEKQNYISAMERKAYYRKVGFYVVKSNSERRPFFVNYLEGNIQATGVLGSILIPSLENINFKGN